MTSGRSCSEWCPKGGRSKTTEQDVGGTWSPHIQGVGGLDAESAPIGGEERTCGPPDKGHLLDVREGVEDLRRRDENGYS